ncbi:MAG: paraquat-inducible protein A [Arcobacter sp.]|nr:paraquat-inducible protein A [Arcobacter sp.]
MKDIVIKVFSLIMLIFLIVFAFRIHDFSLKYEKEMHENIKKNKIEVKIQEYLNLPSEYLNKTHSASVNTMQKIKNYFFDSSQDKNNINLTKEESIKKTNKEQLYFYSILYTLTVLALFFTYFILSKRTFIFILITISFISLIIGISTPIMNIEIYKDLPLLGYTIFKYDSKGILTTIEKLWLIEKYVLSSIVCIFSVVFPLLKIITQYIYLFFNIKQVNYIDILSKWSMADVFIVSLLITNLSLNADKFTNAQLQIGIYFFLSYVIISMLISQVIKKI